MTLRVGMEGEWEEEGWDWSLCSDISVSMISCERMRLMTSPGETET